MALEISLKSAIFHTSKQLMKHPLKYFLLMAPAVCKQNTANWKNDHGNT
jgi:hypothetical protein